MSSVLQDLAQVSPVQATYNYIQGAMNVVIWSTEKGGGCAGLEKEQNGEREEEEREEEEEGQE